MPSALPFWIRFTISGNFHVVLLLGQCSNDTRYSLSIVGSYRIQKKTVENYFWIVIAKMF